MKKKKNLYCKYGLPPAPPSSEDIYKSGVREIVETVKKYTRKPIKSLVVLDVGSGHGEYSAEMAKFFKRVIGVEPYKYGYYSADKNYKKIKNLKFYNSKVENFKTRTKFDVIVSLTVIEHIKNADKAFKHTISLLKPDGLIYLTAPNKYWVFEQHYGLPFLSWLPLPLANVYLKFTKGVESYEDSSYSMGYNGIRRFFDKLNTQYDFLLPVDTNNTYVGCGSKSKLFSIVKRVGIKLISFHPFFWNFSKGFIMVIRKK